MRLIKRGIFVLFVTTVILSGLGCSVKDETEFTNYDFKDLLGSSKSDLISLLGDNYEVTTQGVNDQNLGLKYDAIGVLIGVDEAEDIVVEIQFLDGEYLGISTQMNLEEAVRILEKNKVDILTLNLNTIGKWYICDLGDFRVRLSEDISSGRTMDYVITLQEFN